jgi:hypothetical protein
VFPARYELNSYIVFRKRLVSKRLKGIDKQYYSHIIVQGIHERIVQLQKLIKRLFFLPTRAHHTLSGAGTVPVSHALPAVRFSCLLRGLKTSFQDGVTAGAGFMPARF